MIVENQYERPVVRCIRVDVTEADWKWLENIIAETNGGFNMIAEPSFENCLGGKGSGRCWFLEHCKHGRSLCGGFEHINFSELSTKIEYYEPS